MDQARLSRSIVKKRLMFLAFSIGRPGGMSTPFDSPKIGFKPPSSRRKSKIKSAPEALYQQKDSFNCRS
jgi:hypothetical protein